MLNKSRNRLAKEAIAFSINDEINDLSRKVEKDSRIKILKRNDEEALSIIRHDCAHVMAEAVQNLFPGTQVTIGPAIENGFYYDFARDVALYNRRFTKNRKKNA